MKRITIIAMLLFVTIIVFAKGGSEPSGTQAVGDFKRVEVGELQFDWKIDGDDLVFRMSGPTTGWVAIGFDPTSAMQGANFVLASVVDGGVVARDDYGVGRFSHAPDTEIGGSDNITIISGSESEGRTTIELSIPLDSGDEYDKPLVAGSTYKIIWAYGQSNDDEFLRKHVARGSFEVEL